MPAEILRPSKQDDVRLANILTIRKEKNMNVIPMIAPMPLPNNEPNENSSLDELGAYALRKQTRIIASDKMNGEDLWLMGQALAWAFKKTPHGEREQWFKAQGLKKTYVWQARKLYERATLDQVRNIGLTNALRKFKVVAEKKAKPAAVTVPTKEEDEKSKAPLDSNEAGTEPTGEAHGSDVAENDEEVPDDLAEGTDKPTDDLAEEEEKELKEYQDALRQTSPKTRAVAIQHALELLRDELNAEEIDEELQQTFRQIAELVEELKGLSKHADANEAA
jgi:hypothetical protein